MRRTIEGSFKSLRARRFTLRALVAAAALLWLSATARALPQTFVSAAGADANRCDRSSPCRTFAGAYSKTDAGGEIVVLDSGEYGPLTINRSLSVIARGVNAEITSAGNGLTVSAAAADVVVVHGLTITGKGGFASGIYYTAGAALHVENCLISRFGGHGINFEGAGQLYVKDTAIRNNSGVGVKVSGKGGVARVAIDHSRVEKNQVGVAAMTAASVTVKDAVIAGSPDYGLYVAHSSAGISAESCVVTQNGYGVHAANSGQVNIHNSMLTYNNRGVNVTGATSMVRIEDCMVSNCSFAITVAGGGAAIVSDVNITGNGFGLHNNPSSPGKLWSFGNNSVFGNGSDVSGTIAPVYVR